MFEATVWLVAEVRPRAVLIENVPALVDDDAFRDIREFARLELEHLGYELHWRTLNASGFRARSGPEARSARRTACRGLGAVPVAGTLARPCSDGGDGVVEVHGGAQATPPDRQERRPDLRVRRRRRLARQGSLHGFKGR
ncbi:DNA cytosine methyltransferase [Streptomyces natalensis]|uniref:DNA cytosine methyltransferase n=1 Tax=Streptomyces natalensis TaxID=68242 RepID=UPI0023AA1D56|nr:DNA cytosine methyltransferase [Streptomyces natalensis]